MANYYLHEDGSIDKNKKKVMERNQSRATIEKEKARKELIQARTQYNNYLQQETQKILNTPQPQAPQDIFSQRRTQLQDLTSRNVRQPINNVSPFDFNRRNEFEQQASRNAQAIREASSTDRAKVLKESMTQKQNTYNLKNYMKNVEDVERQNVSTGAKILNPIVSGALDLVDPTRLTGTTTYYDDEGNRTFLPNKRELRQQKVREESSGAVGVYNDIAYNMSKAVTAGVMNMFVPGAGKILYYGNIVDGGVDEAKRQGFSDSEALAYGGIMGIVAGTLDTALDTFGGLSTFTQGKIPTLTQGVDKFFYKIIGNKTLSRILSNVSREALSEFTEEYVDNIAKYMINADASDADSFLDMLSKTWNDATYSALVGGLSGGVGGVIETNTEETRERIKALEDYKKTLESIQPQSPIEAEYKNDEINKVDNQLQSISDNPQVAKYQQELADVEQEKQQLTNEPRTQPRTQDSAEKIIDDLYNKNIETLEKTKNMMTEERYKNNKLQASFDKNQAKRLLKQGNSLEKVEGGLTEKELLRVKEKLNSNFKGKEVIVDNKSAKIIGNSFGKIKVEFEDGTTQIVNKDDIKNNPKAQININDLVFTNSYYSQLQKELPKTKKPTQNQIIEKQSEEITKLKKPLKQNILEKVEEKRIKEAADRQVRERTRFDNLSDEEFKNIKESAEILNLSDEKLLDEADRRRKEIKVENESFIKESKKTIMEPINEKIKESKEAADLLKLNDSIRKTTKQMNLTNKTTNNTIKDIRSIENTKNQTPVENLNSGDITITKKGISTNLSEKMVDDVLKITTPTEKPKTITISDKENTYKVKTPSAEVASKDISEQVGMYYDNLSSDEKREIYRETQKKNTVFAKGQAFAENTGDTDLINAMKSVEEQAYYNQLDIKANLLNNIIDTYKDVDARAESFNKDYLRLSAGTLDGTNLEVSNEVVAKCQGLAIYYLDNHMPKEATDALLKLGKLGTASGQASAQFNAMYQYTPYGIYTQTVKDMQQAYNEMASRKSPNWAKKNNPETNPNSRFRLTTEQTDYILKESSELHKLHSTDFKEYSIRKGKLQNYIADLIPHGFSEGLGNWVRTSLLLGTRTVFKNYGSNVIDTSYHAVNKINYSIYDLGLNKLFGTDIRVAGISLDGSKAGLKAGVQTSVQSLQDIIKGTNSTEFSNRYSDASTSRENITKDFFDTMPTRYQTKIKPLNAVGNWVSQLANNTMTWGDAKFAAASYEDNRVTLRKMNALEQFEKNSSKPIVYNYKTDAAGTTHIDYINTEGKYAYVTTNDTLDNFMKQNNMNLLENEDKIDKIALEYAQSRTYTGDTTFSKVTSSIINTIDKAAAKTPILKQTGIKPSNFIIPFSKIGSNLCYKMYRGSFLSIPSVVSSFQNFKAEVDDGNLSMQTQYDLVSRLGDLTTGTILYAVMGSLAKAAFDNVEGDEDDDEQSKVKKFMQSVFGKDKYTFKVGDFNFSFDVGGNLTNMLKLSLDLQQTNEKEEATFRDYTETTFKDILSEWTVSNLTDLFNEQYNSNALDNILQTIARIPSMTIPTFMKDFATNIDNFTERSIWDEDLGTYALNNIKAKIPPIGVLKPISRETLPEKIDSWQNTMKAGSDLFTNVWNTYLVGGQIKKDKSDSVSDELMNIYLITQKTSVIPNVNKSSFTYDKIKYDLTDEEERKYLKTYATTAHNKLDKLFSSKAYQETDTETKLKYIEEIYTYANDEAKKEYLKGKGIEYYNYGKQVLILGKNDTFKQSQVLDAIDNNISYEAARSYQEDSQKFKFYQSFGSYEKYDAIDNNISDIKKTYSRANGFSDNQRKNTVVNYVNGLNNLSAIQKAILIKQQYPSLYKSYDEKIKQYLKQQNLDEETYNALLSKMKIK